MDGNASSCCQREVCHIFFVLCVLSLYAVSKHSLRTEMWEILIGVKVDASSIPYRRNGRF